MTTSEVAPYLQEANRPHLTEADLDGQCDGWAYVLESALVYAHYSPETTGGSVDGVFDQATVDALKSFQRAAGLDATGETDAATWDALYGAVEQAAIAENEMPTASDLMALVLGQVGERYVVSDVDLEIRSDTLDCADLVTWATAELGMTFPSGGWHQASDVTAIGVNEALDTRGALLWRDDRIRISVGTGQETVEAAGSEYALIFYECDQSFDRAAKISGLRDD